MSVCELEHFIGSALGHKIVDFMGIRARMVSTTLNNKSARVKMSEDVNELNTQKHGQRCVFD